MRSLRRNASCSGAPLSLALIALSTFPGAVRADVRLPAVFSDHMVLQRGRPVPVRGWADPGEPVTVRLRDQVRRGVAGADGRWQVSLAPLEAGGPHTLEVTGRAGGPRLTDVLVGEVWLLGGQSNMAWPVGRAARAGEAIAAASGLPRIRLYRPERRQQGRRPPGGGGWQVCGATTVQPFSALGFFFGQRLHRELGVPVGLIDASVANTPIEAWIDHPALRATPEAAPILARWQRRPAPLDPRRPAGLFEELVAPLHPFALAGVVWYQGESNVDRAHQYRTLFPLLITSWRGGFGAPELPFIFVQLPNLLRTGRSPGESRWAELRDAQLATARQLPHTWMVVTIDIGRGDNIHPPNKREVARRVWRWAAARVYGRPLEPGGPLYRGALRRGRRMLVSFDHVGKGLVARGDDGVLQGFALAGADRRFHWAEARIVGRQVEVWSPAVAAPVAVRYAWADNPRCNLFNAEGLPASPFRSDDWPGLTVDRR